MAPQCVHDKFATGTPGVDQQLREPLEFMTNDSFGIKFGAQTPDVCVSNVQQKTHRRLDKSGELESSLIASDSVSSHLPQYTKPFQGHFGNATGHHALSAISLLSVLVPKPQIPKMRRLFNGKPMVSGCQYFLKHPCGILLATWLAKK
eukprot:s4710_g5.t1